MQPWEIHLKDWVRILFGNVPPAFFIELTIRVIFVYLLVICCIRLMGKRMASQLSRNELVAISSLAASIGIPIQSPERGLIPAVIVALIVVAAQRFISGKASANERFEKITQGHLSILVNDCCVQFPALKSARISRMEVFARLRSMKVTHLGQVKRLYFEAEGDFTLIRNDEGGRPGLCVLPDEDVDMLKEQGYRHDFMVCGNCGKEKNDKEVCDNCGCRSFVPAVV
jgi:uncharacterized membrane protein YcaP (DUF421 family)